MPKNNRHGCINLVNGTYTASKGIKIVSKTGVTAYNYGNIKAYEFHITIQNTTFDYSPKGNLLRCKRLPSSLQKAAFCNAVCRLPAKRLTTVATAAKHIFTAGGRLY